MSAYEEVDLNDPVAVAENKEAFLRLFEACLVDLADTPDDQLVWPDEVYQRVCDRLDVAVGSVLRSPVHDPEPVTAAEMRYVLRRGLSEVGRLPAEPPTVMDGQRRRASDFRDMV